MSPRHQRMHDDLVDRLAKAGADPDEAFCHECATPLTTLMHGGLCAHCIEEGSEDAWHH